MRETAVEFSEQAIQWLEWGDVIAIERPGPSLGSVLFYSLRRTKDQGAVIRAKLARGPSPSWDGYKFERFVIKESLIDGWPTWEDCEHSEWKHVVTLDEVYHVIGEWGLAPSMFVHARNVRYPF